MQRGDCRREVDMKEVKPPELSALNAICSCKWIRSLCFSMGDRKGGRRSQIG
jgi:hypothetical protein